MIKAEYFYHLIAISVVGILFYLFVKLLLPFAIPILWAIIFVVLFYPLYRKIGERFIRNKSLNALFMCFLITVIIIVPFGFAVATLIEEIATTYKNYESHIKAGEFQFLNLLKENLLVSRIEDTLERYIGTAGIDVNEMVMANLKRIGAIIANMATTVVKNFSAFLFNFVLMILSMFYLFKDGDRLLGYTKGILPITDTRRDAIFSRMNDLVYATVYGGVLVAIIQGTVGGVAFWILGLSSPVFWGTMMAFFSFLPILGTAIIWIPAAIILFIKGAYLKGFILILIGTLIVGTIDNVLKPLLISGRTKLHALIVFFSVMGGIHVFGLIGMILGPLLAAICIGLIELYKEWAVENV
ncbi:MAG: AI-2E family transporter [Nitrospirota bacterium]